MWTAPRDWSGEECFVVCGGESARHYDWNRLRGRRVIAINSSFASVPFADYLVFSDRRWWDKHRRDVREMFRGKVVTVTSMRESPDYLLMERQRSGGISPHPTRLALWHTTTCPAANLAYHHGVSGINFVALDGHGGWHHEAHEWAQNRDKFDYHELAIRALVDDLRRHGVRVRNSSPSSRYASFIPHCPYEEMTDARAAA
jgi:hypothetical protein